MGDECFIYDWKDDCVIGDICEKGFQLCLYIVWFGEVVLVLELVVVEVIMVYYIIIIGILM